MNVSLSKAVAHAMPAKTFLPDTGAASGKFSTVLADVKDSSDPSSPDVLNDGGSHVSKKVSAKSDKSNAKPSGGDSSQASNQAALIVNSTTQPGKQMAMNMTLPFALQEESQTHDSDAQSDSLQTTQPDSAPGLQFQFAFADSRTVAGSVAGPKSTDDASTPLSSTGTLVSSQPESQETDSSNAADDEQTAVSSTNLLGTWAAREEGTNFRSLIAPAAANLASSATPDGKPTSPGIKTVSADTVRSTPSALDTKTQTGFTFLQSHDPASSTPPATTTAKPTQRPSSSLESKRESLQNHSLNGSSTGKQEKAAIRALTDTLREDLDGSSGEAPQLGKTLSSGASPAGSPNAVATAAPGFVVSTQISSPVVSSQTGSPDVSPKTSDALPHGPSTAAAEDAEAAVEAAPLSTSSPLHTAKLVAGIERSELRMGLRTGEFGNVDIRTSLVRNQFTAEISAERGELGRALAAELPGLQHRLTEQHLPAASITVQDHSAGGSSDFQQGSRPGHSAPPVSTAGNRAQPDSLAPILAVEAMEATARLDIHM